MAAREALTIAGHKFPIGTKIVKREFAVGESMELGSKALARAGATSDDPMDDGPEFEGGADSPADVPTTEEGAQHSSHRHDTENQEPR